MNPLSSPPLLLLDAFSLLPVERIQSDFQSRPPVTTAAYQEVTGRSGCSLVGFRVRREPDLIGWLHQPWRNRKQEVVIIQDQWESTTTLKPAPPCFCQFYFALISLQILVVSSYLTFICTSMEILVYSSYSQLFSYVVLMGCFTHDAGSWCNVVLHTQTHTQKLFVLF